MKVHVDLGERSYDVVVARGALLNLCEWQGPGGPRRAIVISDEKLEDGRAALLTFMTRFGWEVEELPVTAGEELKTLASLEKLYADLARMRADRRTVIVALGGGTVGDVAGFVAATWMRGVPWACVPSTLVAQLDSCIGGKTAVNLPGGRNLVGAIHQPSLVVCDIDLLLSLPQRELISGLGEALKIGLALDPRLWSWLRTERDAALGGDIGALTHMVATCLARKARLVEKDERDTAGAREVLNLGHTFGHALETLTGFEQFRHGEAVIWGLRFALALSVARGHMPVRTRASLDRVLAEVPVPPLPAGLHRRVLLEAMKGDKKATGGWPRFVLLSRLGVPLVDAGVEEPDLDAACAMMGL